MKASEALEFTNKAIDVAKTERIPMVEEIMPCIYEQIKENAIAGRRKCHLIVNEIPSIIRGDVVDLLSINGYDTEFTSFTGTIDNAINITVKW